VGGLLGSVQRARLDMFLRQTELMLPHQDIQEGQQVNRFPFGFLVFF
jgi:hypothetical protein